MMKSNSELFSSMGVSSTHPTKLLFKRKKCSFIIHRYQSSFQRTYIVESFGPTYETSRICFKTQRVRLSHELSE